MESFLDHFWLSLTAAMVEKNNGVFPKWSRTFIEFGEFSEFRETDKSLKHELGSV